MTLLDELRRELVKLRWWEPKPGYVYRGGADFVLQHGEPYEPRLCGKPPANRACFGNALLLADLLGWRYVEGYALGPRSPIPVHHGWVVTDAGEAVEVTWPILGRAYLGVEFDPLRADDATWNGDASVLDDWLRGFPLFRQRWQGEPDVSPFTPTETLLQARLIHATLGPDHILSRFGERRSA